jgi:hypothetical protein
MGGHAHISLFPLSQGNIFTQLPCPLNDIGYLYNVSVYCHIKVKTVLLNIYSFEELGITFKGQMFGDVYLALLYPLS